VDPDAFLAQVRHLYAHPDEVSRDELRLKDGRTFDRYSAPIRTAEGVNYGRVWYFRDVTEQKHHEEALREGAARLEEALVELNTFAYSVAHDLRGRLRAIAGYSEMIQEDYARALAPGASEYIARITENARRMDKLILDLLTYSRLSREPMPSMPVDLGAILSQVLARFEPEFRQIGVRVDVGGPFPAVLAHPGSLDLVIFNLVSNAVKFVSPGTPPQIRIFSQEKGERVRLWVEDNGIGIAPQHQERIFGVFQQLHVTSEFSGTGIGLAIVKRVIERMGGGVGVESEPGEGSRFWIELKLAPSNFQQH
jgi:signal transduction histidine kinase